MNDLIYLIQCTVNDSGSSASTQNYLIRISFNDDIISAQITGKCDPIICKTSDQLIDNLTQYFTAQHPVLKLEVFEANKVDDMKDHIKRVRGQ